MLLIDNRVTDPYFNLAAEEYMLRHDQREFFMVWQGKPSIIVGKHQNAMAEINHEAVHQKGVVVARRLSGGGTVYHDGGNLNFTFIRNGEEGHLVDFRWFTRPVIELLHSLGIEARHEGKNDITVKGKKISGNAEHVFRKRVLHHGTLLFNSDLQELTTLLRVNPLKYKDKSVKSTRSRVTNIHDHLAQSLSLDEFRGKLLQYIHSSFQGSRMHEFSNDDLRAINHLVETRYGTWEWNYGYSPDYILERVIELGGKELSLRLKVSRGIIQDAVFTGVHPGLPGLDNIALKVRGCTHDKNSLRERLSGLGNENKLVDQLF